MCRGRDVFWLRALGITAIVLLTIFALWTLSLKIIIAVLSAEWALILFYRDYLLRVQDKSKSLSDALIKSCELCVQFPAARQYISQHAHEEPEFFRDRSRLTETEFFQAKAVAYADLIMFDRLLPNSGGLLRRVLFVPEIIELEDWKAYMKGMLRHPLYASIMMHESTNFGKALQNFWTEHSGDKVKSEVDPFVW